MRGIARRKIPVSEIPAIREWWRTWCSMPRPGDMARRYGVRINTLRNAAKQF